MAAFTPGNLVIYRVGTGSPAMPNTGNAVFLDEITPAGATVQTIAMPTTASGSNKPLIAQGRQSEEGHLTLSQDGRYLVLTGYATTLPGSGALQSTTSATVPRVVGRVGFDGSIDTSTALTDYGSGSSPKSVYSSDGTDFWVSADSAGTGGIRYATIGNTTSTLVTANTVDGKELRIFNGQLYVAAGSRFATVGTGVPIEGTASLTNLPGTINTGAATSGFFFASTDASPGPDLLYLVDTTAAGGSILKYSSANQGANWTLAGKIDAGANSYSGLTAQVVGTTVTLYATRKVINGAAGGGELVSIVDNSGFTGNPSSAVITVLMTAATNVGFRGVSFVPTALPANRANTAPVNTVPTTVAGFQDVPVLLNGSNAIRVADDSGAALISVTVSIPAGVGTLGATNGGESTVSVTGSGSTSITFTGMRAKVNVALTSLYYSPTLHRNTPANGATTVTVVTNDSGGSATDAIGAPITGTPLTDTDTFAITLATPMPFTPGNLAIYRVGDGTAALTNNGSSIIIDEYTTAGVLVQSIGMPTVVDGTNQPLIAAGSQGSEGYLTRSVDGRYLLLTGYNTTLGGSTGLAASTTVNRGIARVDQSGAVNSTVSVSNMSGAQIRTVVSTDGNQIWYGGENGVRYLSSLAATPISLVGSVQIRQLNIFNGQLYASTSNNTSTNNSRLATVGANLPTSTVSAPVALPGIPVGDGTAVFAPSGYFFADLNPGVAGLDTLYLADDSDTTGGVFKFSFDGTTWLPNGGIGVGSNNYRGITGSVSGNTVTLYSTRGGGNFVSIVDTSGYNAAPAATISSALASAAAKQAFRGIVATPDDGITAIGGLGGATNYSSGAAATTFASAATFADASNLAGGSLTISYASGGLSGDGLAIANGSGIVAAAGVVTFNGTQIGTYPTSGVGSGVNNNSLVVTFNANGSASAVLSSAVQALLRQVTFATGAAAGNRVLNVAIAQNGGLTATTTQTVSVSAGGPQAPVNGAPSGPVLSTEDVLVSFVGANALSVSDGDAGASPISTIVSVPAGVGTFAATNGGGSATITGGGTASITFSGPQAQINLALATLQFTPALNRNTPADGVTTVTIVTSDGALSDTDSFNITLVDVNDAPVAAADSLGALATESGPAFTIAAATLLANDNTGAPNESTQTFTITAVSTPVGGTASLAGTTITFTPAVGFSGTASFQYTITDNGLSGGISSPQSGTGTVTFTISDINDPPTATADTLANIAEDSGVRTIPFNALTGNDSAGPGEATQTLTIISVSSPVGGTAVISGTNVLFTPTANYNGPASFSYVVQDNGLPPLTATASVSFTIAPVNDDPTISDIVNQNIGVNGSTGVLSFTIGDLETGVASLIVTATSSNTTLVPNNIANLVLAGSGASRTINVIPAAGQSGAATITVTVSDGTTSASDTFVLNVAANTAPTISAVVNQTIAEEGSLAPVAFTVGDLETGAASLSVVATSSNQSIIPNASIIIASTGGGGRTVAIAPTANINGSVTITLTVTDGGGLTAVDTFTLNITEVNDAPTATNDALASINEDSGVRTIPFAALLSNDSTGPTNESAQTLTITSVTAIAGGTVSISGANVIFTPTANFNGSASFSYIAQDNGTTNGVAALLTATGAASFNIIAVNDAPSFAKGADITVHIDEPLKSFAGWATAISAGPTDENGQVVSFNVSNNNTAIFSAQPAIAANGTLTFTPQTGASGTATITVFAQDNGGVANGGVDASASQTFVITILPTPLNVAPTINSIANVIQMIGGAPPTVQLSGITAGLGETQALQVTATSNNTVIVPNPTIGYASPNAIGTLSLGNVTQLGSATITVTVRDAGPDGSFLTSDDGVVSTQFTVTTVPYNAPPNANDATRSTTAGVAISGVLTATDADTPVLTYSIIAPPLLGNITSFNAATGAFTYTPNSGVFGLDAFTFSVTDGISSDTATVRIVVQGSTPTVTTSGGDLIVVGTPAPDQLIVSNLNATTVRVRTQFGFGDFPLMNQLVINGADSNDYIVVSGVLLPTTIDGGAGDDYISSGLQNDTIIGGLGNDQVNASGGNNVVWGDNLNEQDSPTGGRDVLSSLGGLDLLFGGGGNDELYPGDGDDYVYGGAGDDLIDAGIGNDRIYGGDGLDKLYGGAGDDIISGGAGSDELHGSIGSDLLIGGAGADSLDGQDGSDILVGRELTFGSSTTISDAADSALLSLLNNWKSFHPANLLSSLLGPADNAPDDLQGGTGDDDFYAETNDLTSDFNLPFLGADRRF